MPEFSTPAVAVLEGKASPLTIGEIITAIREAEQEWLPWDVIHQARGRQDEITPHLINLLQELSSGARDAEIPYSLGNGAIVALSLLAEFQARECLPVLVDLLMLPGERTQWLFQPEDCELFGRCLASLLGENPELIEQLLDDDRIAALTRDDICQVYWYWLRDGKLSRATAAENLLNRLLALSESQLSEDWPYFLATHYCRLAESGAVDLEAVANAAGTTVAYLSEFVKNSDENYGQTLASLPETHQGFLAELQRYYPDSPEHLTALLNRNYTHNLPRKLIRQLQKHGPEAISSPLSGLLRDESQRLAQALKNGEDDPCCTDGPVFAVYLLTEARCREALPAIIEAISLPGEGPFLLFGDFVTERLNRTLALLGSGSLSSIDALIRDNRLNEYVRSAASGAYHYLVRDGHLTRVEAIAALSQHLEWAIEQQDSSLATSLAANLANFGAWEAAELYDRAFDLKLVDPSMIGRFEIARTPEAGVADFEKYQSWLAASDFDSVEELSRWHCYQPERPQAPRSSYWDFSPPNTLVDEGNFKPNEAVRAPSATIRNTAPAVGRNDACPCGSGKKYKKCCLRGE